MTIQFFLKFGKKKHIESLQNGEFYAATLIDFKKDLGHMRYDPMEGVTSIHHLAGNYIQLREKETDEWKKLNITRGQLNYWLDASKVHSYSLFYISEEQTRNENHFSIPENMKKYGDYYLVIKNPRKFIKMLIMAFDKKGYKYIYDTISYYDPTKDHDKLGFFHKANNHSNEKEFRILIESELGYPVILNIGSLKNISDVMHINQYVGLNFQW